MDVHACTDNTMSTPQFGSQSFPAQEFFPGLGGPGTLFLIGNAVNLTLCALIYLPLLRS